MNRLEEVWHWYERTRHVLYLAKRLGDKHWAALPPETSLSLDDKFKSVQTEHLTSWASAGLEPLDELAVVRLFAAFESLIRMKVGEEIEQERGSLSHPVLAFAATEVLKEVRRGSFATVLRSLKRIDPDLVEEVRQVRQYRNWISHGKSLDEATRVPSVDPRTAFTRLQRLLQAIEQRTSAVEQQHQAPD